ncbi:MAG: hypothetical protein H0W85_10850 [Methylotenera sp.]|nr:hypothetical protein [Methylotenera sp.]
MNKLLSLLCAGALALNAYSALAATQTDNKDDASNLGTSESPQHKAQEMRTDKGPTGTNNGATDMDDASNLGNADSPQHKKQMERSNKNGATQNTHRHHKNKVQRNKEMNEGTTKGNKVQPNDIDNGTPAPTTP